MNPMMKIVEKASLDVLIKNDPIAKGAYKRGVINGVCYGLAIAIGTVLGVYLAIQIGRAYERPDTRDPGIPTRQNQ